MKEKVAWYMNRLRQAGRMRPGETYMAVLHSFMRFRGGKDVLFDEVDSELITAYKASLSCFVFFFFVPLLLPEIKNDTP